MRQLRGSVHPTRHAFPVCKSLFGRIPSRMAVPLKDIVDQNTLLEDGHVFMGFSKDGLFVISYTLILDFGEDNAMPCYSYKLHWWKFRDRQPMIRVSEVQLFAEEKVSLALHLAVCSWPTDHTKILVYGCASGKPKPDEKLACYVTITAVPPSSPCPTCNHIKYSGEYNRMGGHADIQLDDIPPELADEFGPEAFGEPTPPCCLRHSYAVHTRFEMSPPFPGFSPIHSMRKDGVVVLNSGDTLIALSVDLCQVSDAVFSPSAGRFSFNYTPRRGNHDSVPSSVPSPADSTSTRGEDWPNSKSVEEEEKSDSHKDSGTRLHDSRKSRRRCSRMQVCRHGVPSGGKRVDPEPMDLLDIVEQGDQSGEEQLRAIPDESIQSVFEACCQTCRFCQGIPQDVPKTSEESGLLGTAEEMETETEDSIFQSASQDINDATEDFMNPCHISDSFPPCSDEEVLPHTPTKLLPRRKPCESRKRRPRSDSRSSSDEESSKAGDSRRHRTHSDCGSTPGRTDSEREPPHPVGNTQHLCNVNSSNQECPSTPIANSIFQNLRLANRGGESASISQNALSSSQYSDARSGNSSTVGSGNHSIGSELQGSCPYHCPDFEDTQCSTATIRDCSCNMQRIFYSLRRYVERSSIENTDSIELEGFGPDYHNMVPIHVTGPFDIAPLKKSSVVSPEGPCIEVRQITLDAEHYICDAICKRALWGKRYISFTDYDMNILDVCPDTSTVYVLLKALVRAWPENKTSVDIFEFEDNPTSETPEVFETGFSFAWNLKTGTYETLHIEDLSPFDQSQLSKMWNPGFLRTLQLQRKAALPQNHSSSVHVLTNDAVFRNKSLTRLLDPVHYVAITLT